MGEKKREKKKKESNRGRARTCNLLLRRQMRYQLRYTVGIFYPREKFNEFGECLRSINPTRLRALEPAQLGPLSAQTQDPHPAAKG